ncbi:unnamed protein product [Ambrosiozyma monospora]|uniref:Unnamed protein product n=1 Tax=Ambrosiozyma monospora TaxID=43982 RepID=A0ACB5T5Q7_AMBMO|nr:unnamed protein product [Ambrosiozyma monospora]
MSKSEFPAGSLVLTKIKGFPEWPSRVIPFDLLPEKIQKIKPKSIKKRASKSKKTPKDNEPVEILCVKFYGDDEYIWCSNQDLKPLTYEAIDEFLIKKGEIPDKGGNIVGKKAAKTNKVTNAFLLARNKELSWEDFAEYGSYGEPEEEEEEEEEVEEEVEEEPAEDEEEEVEAPKSKKRKATMKKAAPKKKAKTETKTEKATPKLKLKVTKPKAESKAKKSDTKTKATAKGKGKAAPKAKKGKGKVKQEEEDEEEEEDNDYELNEKEEEEEEREEEEAEEEMVKEEEEELEEEQEADWGLESDTENDEHIVDKETFPTSEILAEEVKSCIKNYSDLRVQIQAVLIPSTKTETNGDGKTKSGSTDKENEKNDTIDYDELAKKLTPLINKLIALPEHSKAVLKSTNLSRLLIIILKKPELQNASFVKKLRKFVTDQLDHEVVSDERMADDYKPTIVIGDISAATPATGAGTPARAESPAAANGHSTTTAEPATTSADA